MTIKVLGFLALSLTAASMAANANTETLVYTGAEIGSLIEDRVARGADVPVVV